MKRSKWWGEYSVPLRTISSNDVLLYFFEYDNSATRISAGFLRIRLRIYAVCLRIRRVFLPYFLRTTLIILRIRLLFLLIRLVFLRIRPRITPVFLRILRVFLPYFFGYGVYFRRISSDTTILRLVFIPYILHGILRLVFLLIPAVILQYYLVYENPTDRIFPRNVSTPSVFEFW